MKLIILALSLGLLLVSVNLSVGSYIDSATTLSNSDLSMARLNATADTLVSIASDTDSDGVPEVPAPESGGLPASFKGLKFDQWGTAFRYCAYDHGTVNNGAGYTAGATYPAKSAVAFVLISAGKNRTFDVPCATVLADSTAVSGTDDLVVKRTLVDLEKGVGGSVFHKAPVADTTALNALQTTSLQAGEMRLVQSDKSVYTWTGSAWEKVNLSSYPIASAPTNVQATPFTHNGGPPNVANLHSAILVAKADGTVAFSGYNENGGSIPTWNSTGQTSINPHTNGAFVTLTTPANVVSTFPSIYGNMYVRNDGSMYIAGQGTYGHLGSGGTTNYPTMSQTSAFASAPLKIARAYATTNWYPYSLMLRADGTLWSAGNNSNYQLGNGNTTQQNSWVQVASAIKDVETAGGCTWALTTNGTVYSAGNISYCKAGSTGATNWNITAGGVNSIAIGYDANAGATGMVLKSDGTAWIAGANTHGQLGQGNTTASTALVQVPLSNVQRIAMGGKLSSVDNTLWGTCSYVLLQNGDLYATGFNKAYALGTGTNTNVLTWTKVNSNVKYIYPDNACYTTLVQKTDNTWWIVGKNSGYKFAPSTTTYWTTWTQITLSS